ncbi:hypothetical protein ACC785_39235, partial [Rhizobium ruizarguesonis]
MKATKAPIAALLIMAALPAAARGGGGLPEQVREANARFRDVNQAGKEGYSPIPCTSGIDGG